METRGRFLEWKFGPLETLGFGLTVATVAVSITLWSIYTFQSKEDAEAMRAQIRDETASTKLHLERRIEAVEESVRIMQMSLEGVAKDVSYIRGRLEPRDR